MEFILFIYFRNDLFYLYNSQNRRSKIQFNFETNNFERKSQVIGRKAVNRDKIKILEGWKNENQQICQ